nr:hypothetical protein GCM10017745_38130 [Saccharothrix mutabilis subsp. capreolus]
MGLVAGVALALGVVAPAAVAEVPGRVTVTQTGPAGLADKEVVVVCPSGTRLYSAGGSVEGGPTGSAIITRVVPAVDLSRAVVGARGVKAVVPWSITAWAVCGQGSPVLVRSAPVVGAQAVDLKSASADCPGVGSLTGVYGEVVDPSGQATLYGLVPSKDLTTATAKASGPVDGQWSVKAWGSCDAALVGKTYIEIDTGAMKGDLVQKASAQCAPGSSLLGGGGTVKSNSPDSVASLTGLYPDWSAGSMTVVGTKGASPWSIEAYAICEMP